MEYGIKRRKQVFFAADGLLILVSFTYVHYHMIHAEYALSILEGIAGAIYLGLALWVIRCDKRITVASWILVVLMVVYLLMTVGFMDFPPSNMIWLLIPYFVSVFLLGWRGGLIAGTFLFSGVVMVLILRYCAGENALPLHELAGIGFANLFALLFAVFYEKTRWDNEKELLDKNREIEILSNHDGLTGLYNRRYFDMMLNNEYHRGRREHQPLALIIADIDLFKNYNDTFGHVQGDICLNEVANAIHASITRTTDIAARYGGEEFAILLPNTNTKGAITVAERIRHAIADKAIPHPLASQSDVVSLSLGISVLSLSEDQKPHDLLQRADRALYVSKSKGRNRLTVITA